jgi:hypothetical protein
MERDRGLSLRSASTIRAMKSTSTTAMRTVIGGLLVVGTSWEGSLPVGPAGE